MQPLILKNLTHVSLKEVLATRKAACAAEKLSKVRRSILYWEEITPSMELTAQQGMYTSMEMEARAAEQWDLVYRARHNRNNVRRRLRRARAKEVVAC